MKQFFQEIKERKVRKWLTMYLSSIITSIGILQLFSMRYQLPHFLFDAFLVISLFGFGNVFLIAWNHGKTGRQHITKMEMLSHTLILITALTVAYLFTWKNSIRILHENAKIIAVLPFVNINESKEDDFFCDGITEDILTRLSKIADLKVISRTSVLKYKNTKMSIKEIATELGAGSILEGSFRRVNNRVRITSQLINANSDEHLWAETYDRKLDDIFKIQSEIAERIANELEAQLAPKEKLLIEGTPTDNLEAYAFCLRGRELAERYTDDDNEKAIGYYKQALVLDPEYALAYASLASAYDQKVRRYLYSAEWQDSAIAMSKKSLEINPNLAEGHSSLAKSYEAKGDFNLAKYHYEEAIRLNPNFSTAIHNLAVVHFNKGTLDEAYRLVKKSILLKPNDVFSYVLMGGIFQNFGCDRLATNWFERALQLDNENLLALLYIIEHYILMNDFQNAQKYFDRSITAYPDNFYVLFLGGKFEMMKGNFQQSKKYFEKSNSISTDGEYEYAYVLQQLNQDKQAFKILNKELDLCFEQENNVSGGSVLNAKNLADIYAVLGENDKSLKWLQTAVDRGWTDSRKNLIYPYLKSVRDSKSFNDLIRKMKFNIDSMKIIVKENDSDWEVCK